MDKKFKSISVFRKNLIYNTQGELDSNQPEYLVSESLFELPHGKLLRETHWSADGQLEQAMVYKYTSKGFLLSEELLDHDESVLEKRTFEADSNNRIACEMLHYADGSADLIKYFRDTQNRIIRKEYFAEDDFLEVVETFEYDGEQLVKELKTDNEGNLNSESDYTYNEIGKLVEAVVNNPEEEYWLRKIYTYDDQGGLTTVTSYNQANTPLERFTYLNDEKGWPVKITEENKRHSITTEIEYNDKGEIVFQAELDQQGQLIKQLEKTYDESGLLTDTQILVRDFNTGVSRSYRLTNRYVPFENQTE
jgi:hypothetical protein